MPYYNVIQAAAYIGCDPKTVRRWLKKGRLTGERTERGWLAIPGGQVEYAKIQWEQEQAQFAGPRMPKDAQDVPSGQPKDLVDRIRRLESTVVSLSATTEALEQRIATLEQALSNASLPVPSAPADAYPGPDVPKDTLSARDFAAQLNIKYTVFEGMMRHGIKGEPLEHTKVPIQNRSGHHMNLFTVPQQEKARELLRKHGKL